MQSYKRIRTVFLATGIVGLAWSTPIVRADSVGLDTGTQWNVARTPNGYGDPTAYSGAAVDLAPFSDTQTLIGGPWVAASAVGDGNAQWISWEDTGWNYNGDYGDVHYTYTDTFQPVASYTGPAELRNVSVAFASDNWVSAMSISYQTVSGTYTVPIVLPAAELTGTAGFSPPPWTASLVGGSLPLAVNDTFTLTVNVVNGYNVDYPGNFNNPGVSAGPTGFILSGTAIASVPLPAAAGVGFSLLGGFGALAAIRKRVRRSPRIA